MLLIARRAGIDADDPYSIVLDTQRETATATLSAVEQDREDREAFVIELQRMVARIEIAFGRVEDTLGRTFKARRRSEFRVYCVLGFAALVQFAAIRSAIHTCGSDGITRRELQGSNADPTLCGPYVNVDGRIIRIPCVFDAPPGETAR